MNRKAKLLNFLKILGICCGAMVGILACVVIYVWSTGGFKPPFVELTQLSFEQKEYVIKDGNDFIKLIPNEGCTELDAVIKIYNTNILVIQEEDKETVPGDGKDDSIAKDTFNVKINQKINVKPVTKKVEVIVNGEKKQVEYNVGGWVRLKAEQGLFTTDCWVFVDSQLSSFELVGPDALTEVYPGDKFSVGINNVFPENALNVPQSSLPIGHTSTAFMDNKIVYYTSTDQNVATVDDNGNVVVSDIAEGHFSINAYAISLYDNINKVPKREDYGSDEEGYQQYLSDFNKIRIWAKATLDFNIKNIDISKLSVTKTPKTYQVFDKANLKGSDFDVQLSTVLDSSNLSDAMKITLKNYIDSKMLEVEIFAGYFVASDAVQNAISVGSGEDIKYIVLTDKYIKIEKLTTDSLQWKQQVIDFKAGLDANCIYFRLVLSRDELGVAKTWVDDYTPITIEKLQITDVEVILKDNLTKLNLDYKNLMGTDLQSNIYDLTGDTKITPNKTTYTKVMYFTEKEKGIIETDDAIAINLNGKVYAAVCGTRKLTSTDNPIAGETERAFYGLVVPKNIGSTTIVACIVKTDIDGNILKDDAGANIYEIDFYSSNNITVNISQKLVLGTTDIVDANDVQNPANKYLNDDKTKGVISTEIAIGQEFNLKVASNSELAFLNAYTLGRLTFVSNNENILRINAFENNGKLIISLSGIAEGATSLTVYYDEKVYCNVGFTITSDKVTSLTLKATEEIFADINGSSFVWKDKDKKDFEISLLYTPINCTIKSATLETYLEPSLPYDINNIDINNLVASKEILELINDPDGNVEKLKYNIKSPGRVIIIATSLDTRAGKILSNAVLVKITIPEIVIAITYGGTGLTKEEQVSIKGKSISLINTRSATGVEGAKFTAKSPNNEIDYTANLFKFMFDGEQSKTGDTWTSQKSGAVIDNANMTITFSDIAKDVEEQLIIYTDFGFINKERYIYSLKPDYNFTPTYSNDKLNVEEYNSLMTVDIFAENVFGKSPTEKTITPVILTNAGGDILFLPKNYNIANLQASVRAKYSDIQCILDVGFDVNGKNYATITADGKIKFFNSQVATMVTIFVTSPSGYQATYNTLLLPVAQFKMQYNNLTEEHVGEAINKFANFDITGIENKINLTGKDAMDNNTPYINLASDLNNLTTTIDSIEFYSTNYGFVIEKISNKKVIIKNLSGDIVAQISKTNNEWFLTATKFLTEDLKINLIVTGKIEKNSESYYMLSNYLINFNKKAL